MLVFQGRLGQGSLTSGRGLIGTMFGDLPSTEVLNEGFPRVDPSSP
ncbi:hypothetical protein [Daejeonella lutea]|uniref:Uncharacterized protein n=1 Tax=Daejeonella lutea TaxID=572036 RepID=A0A1T5FEK1_9SPHI|nr:hypothetical protein [Daejeonella lutea]SKB94609.1 hypothetical protein SAMN05661099_3633 [Daejeonella lutea]